MRTQILVVATATLLACARPSAPPGQPSLPRHDYATSVTVRIGLARSLLDHRELLGAREQALRLVQDAPDFIEGWVLLCETLLQLGRANEARTVLAAAHRIFGTLSDLTVLDERALAARGE